MFVWTDHIELSLVATARSTHRPLPARQLAIHSQRAAPDQPPPSQLARRPLPACATPDQSPRSSPPPPIELSGRPPWLVTAPSQQPSPRLFGLEGIQHLVIGA